MNQRQKQVEKQLLDNEKAALKALEDNYTVALADVKTRIKELMADELTQSKIYRLEYQRNLERQIKAILGVLESGNVKTVNDYLKLCYEDGFIGTLYDISGDGTEMVLPINQDQVASSVTRPTESVKLSKRLYNDVARLQKDVVAEMSRGLSQNLSYRDIAINLANVTEASLKRAYRIARTEGHRVQNEAKLDSMHAARDAGADIVKMWDATMDGKTRPDHVILDGQIRELDEPFTVNGHEAMAPGHFGLASEDVHCRCVMLQRARWALEGERLKRDQDAREIVSTEDESYKAWKSRYHEDIVNGEIVKTFSTPVTGHNGVKDKAIISARTELDQYFQVTGYHCDGTNFLRDDLSDKPKNWISPEKMARKIKDLVQKSGKPVKIYSCNAGADGAMAAQRLADALGVEVKAPMGYIALTESEHGAEFHVMEMGGGNTILLDVDEGWTIVSPRKEGV